MQAKGNILLVLLIMLFFASAALLQLNEDHYLARLIELHVKNLLAARQVLSRAVISFSAGNSACYSELDTKKGLEDFWRSHQSVCEVSISAEKVSYVFRDFQEDQPEGQSKERSTIYRQITLRTKNGKEFEWLRVVKEQKSGALVSWTYHFL